MLLNRISRVEFYDNRDVIPKEITKSDELKLYHDMMLDGGVFG